MKRLAMLAMGGLIALLPSIASARSNFFLGFNFRLPVYGGYSRAYYAPSYSYSYYAPAYTYSAPVYAAPVYSAPPPVTYYTAPAPAYYAPPVTYYSAPAPVTVYQYSGPSVYFHYGWNTGWGYGRYNSWGRGGYYYRH